LRQYRETQRRASSPPFLVTCISFLFYGRGLFTLTPTLSSERKGSATLTLALSPQGRGNLLGKYPYREREIKEGGLF
jgi:hypothetical protein